MEDSAGQKKNNGSRGIRAKKGTKEEKEEDPLSIILKVLCVTVTLSL